MAVPELSLFVACSSEMLLHAAGVRDGHRCQYKQCRGLPFESQWAVERRTSLSAQPVSWFSL